MSEWKRVRAASLDRLAADLRGLADQMKQEAQKLRKELRTPSQASDGPLADKLREDR